MFSILGGEQRVPRQSHMAWCRWAQPFLAPGMIPAFLCGAMTNHLAHLREWHRMGSEVPGPWEGVPDSLRSSRECLYVQEAWGRTLGINIAGEGGDGLLRNLNRAFTITGKFHVKEILYKWPKCQLTPRGTRHWEELSLRSWQDIGLRGGPGWCISVWKLSFPRLNSPEIEEESNLTPEGLRRNDKVAMN